MKKVVSILIFYALVTLSSQPVFAQANRWQLVGRSGNGSTSYVDKSVEKQNDGTRRIWIKNVLSDGYSKISLTVWQCRTKKFRILEMLTYQPSGEYLYRETNATDWVTVVPSSFSENYYKIACASTEQKPVAKSNSSDEKMVAQIITENANIREAPFANSPIIQKIEKGARLFLADAEPTGAWYQVFLPDSDIAGWLYGSTVKLLNIKSNSNQRKQKTKPAEKRGEARKRN